jgi:hypothetical protein
MQSKKINELGTNVSPSIYDLTVIGDASTGQLKKITLNQIASLFGSVGGVSSVAMTVPTGLTVTGSPITTSGTLAVTLSAGYSIPTTAKQSEWDTGYAERLKWDGGASGLSAPTARTSLGLVIGTDVLAYRTFGSAANNNTGDFATAAQGVSADTAYTNRITGASLPLSISSNVISIAEASTTISGFLSSTNFNIFNGKQAALNGTGFVKATGTTISYDNTSYLPLGGGTLTGELAIRTNTTTGLNIISSTGTQSLWVRAGYDTDGTATPIVSANNIEFQSSGSGAGSFSFVVGNNKALFIASNSAATFTGALSGTSATFSTQLKVSNLTGTALDMLVLETSFDNPSGNKSIIWKDATNPLGRISVSYDAGLGGSTMSFGSLYNGGYQTSNLLTISPNGSVGIGTNSPAAILHTLKSGTAISGVGDEVFIGQRSSSTHNAAVTIVSANESIVRFTNTASVELGAIAYETANNNMLFKTNASERMRITSGGNVGIGTSSPSNKLDVRNGGDFDVKFRSEAAGGTVGLLLETANSFSGTSQAFVKVIGSAGGGQSQLIFGTAAASSDTTATERMRISSAGNVLINSSVDNGQGKLQISGNIYVSGIAAAGSLYSVSSTLSTSYYHVFNGSSGQTLTLPSPLSNNVQYVIINNSANTVTLAAATSTTIITTTGTGVASITLIANQRVFILADGNNKYYQIF